MDPIVVSRDRATVAVITLNRPAKRNAVTLAMWRDLGRLFRDLAEDPAVRAVVLTGAGGHFCAGADISEFGDTRAGAGQGIEYDRIGDEATLAIQRLPTPTVAAIEGYCLGGGCGLAMACDFRVAHESAVFGIPAARLGIVYGLLDTRNLVALVGAARARRILFGGRRFDAADAAAMGLVDQVTPESVLAAAIDFVSDMAANAPLSIAGAKTVVNALVENRAEERTTEIDTAVRRAFDSDDYREGVRAFAERREPIFTGR